MSPASIGLVSTRQNQKRVARKEDSFDSYIERIPRYVEE
jgi:hypothetical protein